MKIEGQWFGILPPEAASVAWGARALFEYDRKGKLSFSFLWDRQQAQGNDKNVLEPFLQNKLHKVVTEMLAKSGVGPRDARLVVEEVDGWTVAIDPRSSCGYLYLGVWR